MEIRFRFGWFDELGVDYRREVRETKTGASASFSAGWRWRVERVGEGLTLRPEDVRVDVPIDTRAPLEHRPLLDALRDRPRALRVGADGRFVDVIEPERFARAAGVSDRTLAGLSPSARALVDHVASGVGQRAAAADLWQALVGFCVDVEALDDGQVVMATLPAVSLPALGASVPMLLQAEAHAEHDGARVVVVSEPDPDLLARAMSAVAPGGAVAHVLDYRLRTTTELITDPSTLTPRRLSIEREHATGVAMVDGTVHEQGSLEECVWRFTPARATT